MFTGIVEELGEVVSLERGSDSARLTVRGPSVTGDAVHGASIAVNGVCLTVVERTDDLFTVDVMAETLRRSSLGDLEPGSPVNLERAMAAGGRFGGHVVQGHVDGTAELVSREPGDRWEVVTFTLPDELARYVVLKGSITVDGVSLTVSDVTDPMPTDSTSTESMPTESTSTESTSAESTSAESTSAESTSAESTSTGSTFSVSLIPTTLELTTLGRRQPGERVNLEVDVIAKYVERLLAAGAGTAGTTEPSDGTAALSTTKENA